MLENLHLYTQIHKNNCSEVVAVCVDKAQLIHKLEEILMANLLVIHGPNLNLLGQREPEHYGSMQLSDIDANLVKIAKQAGHQLTNIQSNAEHELVDAIQAAQQNDTAFIVINPAAFTHTSVALRDAIAAVKIPFIEIHLSNVYARESFRKNSYFSDLAVGVICGLGPLGYELALQAAIEHIES